VTEILMIATHGAASSVHSPLEGESKAWGITP
jgi:hypothetical protein